MAAVGILSYNLTQGLKMKTANENSNNSTSNLVKTFNKITVQNVLSESSSINTINISSSNANAIVKKMKDFGMIGTVNAVNSEITKGNLNRSNAVTPTTVNRKRPLTESKIDNIKTTTTPMAKKPKFITKVATPKTTTAKKSCENLNQNKLIANVISSGTPGRKGLPAPQAVARRNARERNRVKQVNNGFAALRERIPEEVAEVFEAQGNHGRGGVSKKLSKVETLRMAVEYIRSLERLLGFDFPIGKDRILSGGNTNNSDVDNDSFMLIKDELGNFSPSGYEDHDQYDDSLSNYDLDDDFPPTPNDNTPLQSTLGYGEPPAMSLDLLPNITTLNGLQYIRIPGTNTYQLLTVDLFTGNSNSPPTSNVDEDNFNALIDTNCLSPSSSSVTTTADLHSSPPTTTAAAATATASATSTHSIMQTKTSITITATAPALQLNSKNTTDHVKVIAIADATSSLLSRSPVPQRKNSSPPLQPATFSPVANELLLQTCADRDDPQSRFVAPQPSRLIKQEFHETDFVVTVGGGGAAHSPTPTSITNGAIIYQQIIPADNQLQHQQQLLLGQTSMSMSPPLDHGSGAGGVNFNTGVVNVAAAALPGYFDHDHNESFYEGAVTFKKELSDVILDTSNTATGLSDESMIEAIDWWEAHTPKSDGGSVIM